MDEVAPVRAPHADAGSWGTVFALVGRYFAGRIDMLTHERVKSLAPIDGSPFALAAPSSGAGESGGSSLSRQLAASAADYLVVDNTGALLRLCERDGTFHTFARGQQADVVETVWDGDEQAALDAALSPPKVGLTEELRAAYLAFVDACLEVFEPARIILVRSRVARFWVDEHGDLAPTNGNDRQACFLAELDDLFLARTGCLVSDAALGQVPSSPPWHSVDRRLRVTLEDDVMRLARAGTSVVTGPDVEVPPPLRRTAAGHVIRAVAHGHPVDGRWLRKYFRDRPATHDDLLALVFLRDRRPGRHDRLLRACVRRAVRDPRSYPAAVTRRGFERSVAALRHWEATSVQLPRRAPWRRQVVVTCDSGVFRFSRNGEAVARSLRSISPADAEAVVDGRVPTTPADLAAVVRSWPVYLERARRGVTAAPRVQVRNSKALLDSCYWVDWEWVLANESVVITRPGGRDPDPSAATQARTDLSFVFDPRVRIGTVGGGLMDQVTHIALFQELCEPHGLDLYLDDFRYTWWRSHNGFEASRLAPHLEARRMSRLVSGALRETFRAEVVTTRLPWVFSQSRAWQQLGLREAFVVTRDYSNSRRLVEIGPDFPFLVYDDDDDLARHIEHPPRPVTFFTTQHRIAIAPQSAGPLSRVFSYGHLASSGLPTRVADTAAALQRRPHVALHVRRGDYLHAHFDTRGWHAAHDHYVAAIRFLIDSELGRSDFDVAVFSDDLAFVEEHAPDYGLDLVEGEVRFVGGNHHFDSIFDSYLMSLCPVIVGSVGFFAATTSLLADPPSVFVRAQPGGVRVGWRREAAGS